MKSSILYLALALGAIGSVSARAEANAPVNSPATVSGATNAPTTPAHIVVTSKLPTVPELSKIAAAQGLNVDKIEQTATQVTLTGHTQSGQVSVLTYALPGDPAVAAAGVPAPAVVYTTPTVVYAAPGYYDYPYYAYRPHVYYPRVGVRIGFGGAGRWR